MEVYMRNKIVCISIVNVILKLYQFCQSKSVPPIGTEVGLWGC